MQNPKLHIIAILLSSVIMTPAYAESSFFDSMNKTFHKLSDTVRDKINNYYCDGSDETNTEFSPSIASPNTAPTPPPKESPFDPCRKFLGLLYDGYGVSDPKKMATKYLNGFLDYRSVDFDAKLSDEEIRQRNKCVVIALDAGADPNSNGENNDDPILTSPVPLARAIEDNDEFAVKVLLEHKANPNALDTSLGKGIPLLGSAVYKSEQDIALDLINAGADLSVHDLMWSASGNGSDKVVDVLIQSKKIPTNQIAKFSDFPDDEGETAMDASERAVDALKAYQKKFSANSKATLQDKFEEVNHILYYTYPLRPQLKYQDGAKPVVDPDAFIADLLLHQQHVSDSLKAAGWTCKQDHCGIVDFTSP